MDCESTQDAQLEFKLLKVTPFLPPIDSVFILASNYFKLLHIFVKEGREGRRHQENIGLSKATRRCIFKDVRKVWQTVRHAKGKRRAFVSQASGMHVDREFHK